MRVESEAEGDEPALLGLDELGGLDLARAVAESHLDAGTTLAGLDGFLGDGFHDGDVAKTRPCFVAESLAWGGALADLGFGDLHLGVLGVGGNVEELRGFSGIAAVKGAHEGARDVFRRFGASAAREGERGGAGDEQGGRLDEAGGG